MGSKTLPWLVVALLLAGATAARSAPLRGTESGGCPRSALALPAAGPIEAARRALLEAPHLYRSLNTRGTELLAVDRAAYAGPRGREVERLCGTKAAERTVVVQLRFPRMLPSASLSEGVVAVGRFAGGYRVWKVLH